MSCPFAVLLFKTWKRCESMGSCLFNNNSPKKEEGKPNNCTACQKCLHFLIVSRIRFRMDRKRSRDDEKDANSKSKREKYESQNDIEAQQLKDNARKLIAQFSDANDKDEAPPLSSVQQGWVGIPFFVDSQRFPSKKIFRSLESKTLAYL